MWIVEAKTFGKNSQLFRYGPTSREQAKNLEKELIESGEWAQVLAWDIEAADQEAA